MLRRLLIVAAAVALPSWAAAQDPNTHASDTAKAKVAAHKQNPQVPAPEASVTAKARVTRQRTTQVRGAALDPEGRPITPATPAIKATRATPATPGVGGGAATPAAPAAPATPAVPASPSQKPASPGQSASHRP